jgi:hypothetical protein
MTQSLFLAQQSANHRLEELEDQAINEDTSGEDSTALLHSLSPSPSSPLSPATFARHKRNRSSTVIDAVVSRSIISTSSADKRTSILLNECVFETDRSFSTVGRGPPGTFDPRQSIVYSEALLRRWTKHLDSTPIADSNVVHQPLQIGSSIEPVLQSGYSLDTEVDSKNDPGPRDLPPQTLFTFSHLSEATAENAKKSHLYSPRGSSAVSRLSSTLESTKFVRDPLEIVGLGGPLDSIYRVSDDFQPSMEDEIKLLFGQFVRILHEYSDGWVRCHSRNGWNTVNNGCRSCVVVSTTLKRVLLREPAFHSTR